MTLNLKGGRMTLEDLMGIPGKIETDRVTCPKCKLETFVCRTVELFVCDCGAHLRRKVA
jgi:hypothetical protein